MLDDMLIVLFVGLSCFLLMSFGSVLNLVGLKKVDWMLSKINEFKVS